MGTMLLCFVFGACAWALAVARLRAFNAGRSSIVGVFALVETILGAAPVYWAVTQADWRLILAEAIGAFVGAVITCPRTKSH